jgi:hypothetical protein
MVLADQPWITEIVRKRNAVEHPGGQSGTLTIQNIQVDPDKAGTYVQPIWQRTGIAAAYILSDMNRALDDLLTFGEDIIVEVIKAGQIGKMIAFYEIPEAERKLTHGLRATARTLTVSA